MTLAKKISIVGFGRFGVVLYELLKDDFEITVYSKEVPASVPVGVRIAQNIEQIYESDTVFFAVPIEAFEDVIASHKQHFDKRHTLIDCLSVKMYPAHVLEKHVEESGAQAILTHPMFGPDSAKSGFEGLRIVMNQCTAGKEVYTAWKQAFEKKGLSIVELTPEEHDRLAADSQGLTHFLGRLLEIYPMNATLIDTLGAKKLLEVKDLTQNDTWQLFSNLQHYNPFTKDMRIRLGEAHDKLYNKLLPTQVNSEYITYGIQGGIGSFNEEAIRVYLKDVPESDYRIQYLHTTENVLRALHAGNIDRGQFAIHNSVGGIVGESIHAMAAYKFSIVEEFAIKISHALMIRKDIEFSEIKSIMAHPQVFAQCRANLKEKYPHLKLVSGEGEMIDHAVVARELAAGNLPRGLATMGSRVLAELYGLKIIEDNLQDAKENFTSFLMVSRCQDT